MANNAGQSFVIPSLDTTDLVLRALRKRYIAGLVVAVVSITAAIFYTVGMKKIYRASATVLIDPSPPQPLGAQVHAIVDMGAGAFWANKEYYATQHKLIAGRAVAKDTVRLLGLQNDPSFLGNMAPGAPVRPMAKPASLDEAANALMSRIKVEPQRDTRLVVVSLDDANPQRGRKVLAALLDVYLQRNVDFAVNSSTAAGEWLGFQVSKLKGDLENSELALHEYKKDKRILSVSLDDQSNMLRGEMTQLNDALTHVNTHREELKARLEQLEKIDPQNPTELPATELLTSTVLQQLRGEYIRAQSEYHAILGSGKGENHPEVESLAARVDTTRSALMNEVKNVQGAIRNEFVSASKEASGVSALYERAKQRAFDLNMLEIEYRRLERTKDNTEKLYGLVLERSKESEITSSMRFNNIRVTDDPLVAGAPVSPRFPLNIGVGAALGLVLGLGLMIGWELTDRKLRAPDDVEADLGVPLLGALQKVDSQTGTRSPYYGRQRRRRSSATDQQQGEPVPPELIVHSAPSSSVAESARGIRTSLMFASPDKPQQLLLITSASPGEGKTMTASTIAIAFAQAGHRTLLMDCDLRRSRLHRVFRQSNDVGVSSSMYDATLLESPNLITTVPNLNVLPAGPRVANPAELLQSNKFSELISTLRKRYDKIVIDSPPVTAVTDAVIISTLSDATILVVRAAKTQRNVAAGALRTLRDVSAPLLGCVLNCIEPLRRGRGYYYYHYYRDSEYTSGEKSKA